MMKAVNAKEFDMVASWSVDRLGRSLTDLLSILQGLNEKGVGLFLHQQGLDTTTTAGKAMFQMLGAFAEFRIGADAWLDRAGAADYNIHEETFQVARDQICTVLLFSDPKMLSD